MGIAIILLGFPLAILAWVLIARKLKQKSYSGLSRHLAGFAGSFVVWWICIIVGAMISPEWEDAKAEAAKANSEKSEATKEQEKTVVEANSASLPKNTLVASEPKEQAAEQMPAKKPEALLGITIDQYIDNANYQLKQAGTPYKINKKITISSGKVNDVAKVEINDQISAVLTLRKNTRDLQSVLVIFFPNKNAAQGENLKDMFVASALASSVDGKKSIDNVGSDIISKLSDLFIAWGKNDSETQQDKFTHNNVVYSMSVSSFTGVLISAASADN